MTNSTYICINAPTQTLENVAKKPRTRLSEYQRPVAAIVASRRHLVDEYKVAKGCRICGYNRNPRSLCFNHLDEYKHTKHPVTKNGGDKNAEGKGKNGGGISNLYHPRYSAQVLIDEIAKCELVCTNCHNELTYPKETRPDKCRSNNTCHAKTTCHVEDRCRNPEIDKQLAEQLVREDGLN